MPSPKITHADVRMYRLGTGDCFAIKFFAGENLQFKMMIDAGCWQGSKEDLKPFVADLLDYLDHHVHLLVVTHEHKDHVLAFELLEDLFLGGPKKFQADQVWMAWTEEDGDRTVQTWKEDYGQTKRRLAIAAERLAAAVADPSFEQAHGAEASFGAMQGMRKRFSETVNDFVNLHFSDPANYVGGLKGMLVVKEKIAGTEIEYRKPKDVIDDLPGTTGIRFFVLGPPELHSAVKKEAGGEGQSYDHNRVLQQNQGFADVIAAAGQSATEAETFSPFDLSTLLPKDCSSAVQKLYDDPKQAWRKIDDDWLFSTGELALRMNSLTNNLSLALAIEFESGRVMLFPGDAEFGSWQSWHNISWSTPSSQPGKHLTEDLLNRTVFYKVAHHLSHNGTARSLGLEMMTHRDLAAMATLDYDNISNKWTSTMPNRAILRELINRTRGRLMIMNEVGLFMDFNEEQPLTAELESARNRLTSSERDRFERDHKVTELYIEYRVRA